MPIQFITGDLFVNRFQSAAFAHGCNCAGSMGAGIAVGFREHYPAMFEEFRRRCKAKPAEFSLGDVFFWQEEGKPAVFNLGTQLRPGFGASYPVVEKALRALRERAEAEGIESVAMPRVAAGYGGLSWKKVRALVEAAFADWPGTLYVYEEFKPGE